MTYATTILGDSPVRYWRLGETMGTTLVDTTGNVNGSYSGSPTLNQTSLLPSGEGGSVRFTAASSQYAQVFDSSSTRLTTYSIECWIKQASDGSNRTIIESYGTGSGSPQRDRNVFIGTTSGFVSGIISGTTARLNDVAILTDSQISGLSSLATHYVVLTFSYSGGVCTGKLYVDAGTPNTVTNSSFAPDTNSSQWDIARDVGLGGTWAQSYFDGWIQEIAVYNYVLSAAQITAHYNAASVYTPVDSAFSSGVVQLGTSPADFYVVPVSAVAQARELRIENTLNTPVTANVSWGVDAVNKRWLSGKRIEANDAYEWEGLHIIPAGTRLQASCSDASACTIFLNGILQA